MLGSRDICRTGRRLCQRQCQGLVEWDQDVGECWFTVNAMYSRKRNVRAPNHKLSSDAVSPTGRLSLLSTPSRCRLKRQEVRCLVDIELTVVLTSLAIFGRLLVVGAGCTDDRLLAASVLCSGVVCFNVVASARSPRPITIMFMFMLIY